MIICGGGRRQKALLALQARDASIQSAFVSDAAPKFLTHSFLPPLMRSLDVLYAGSLLL